MANKVNQRKGHRAYVTKTLKEVETLLATDEPDEATLLSFQSSLTEKMDTLCNLDDEILGTIEQDEQIAAEIENSSNIRQNMQKTLIIIGLYAQSCLGYTVI